MSFGDHMRRGGMLLLVVLGLALTASGFAHKAPSIQDERLQSYMLAGGDLAEICGMAGMFGTEDGCSLCPLVGHPPHVTPVPKIGHALPAMARNLVSPKQITPFVKRRDCSRLSRGPPLA